jgi:chromosome segregation ATPase
LRRASVACDEASALGLEAAAERMDAEIADLVARQELYEKRHAEYEAAIAEHNSSASEKEMVLFRVRSNLDMLALQRELDQEESKRRQRRRKERARVLETCLIPCLS